MLAFKKALSILALSAFIFSLLGLSRVAAQTGQITVPNPYQSTPIITSPLEGSVVKETIPVLITIEPPTVVQKIEVYANSLLIGLARPQDSIHWSLDWNTANYPNSQYHLLARATIISGSGYPIDTFSPRVLISVNNPPATTPSKPAQTTEPLTQTTPVGEESTKVSEETTQTEETQTTEATAEEVAFEKSQWKTLATITFPRKSDNQLDKIEYKIDQKNQEYLVFAGRATPSSQVTLTLNSQPIVLTTRADSTGNWEYILEKPLEPGNHQVKVEIINPNGQEVTDGPYNFLIARAQATAENPTGASLQLMDTNRQLFLRYFLIATGLILAAVMALFLIRRARQRRPQPTGKI